MLRITYWSKPVRIGVEVLAGGPGSPCIAAILIWMLVSLRLEDLGLIRRAHLGEPKWDTPNSQCSQDC